MIANRHLLQMTPGFIGPSSCDITKKLRKSNILKNGQGFDPVLNLHFKQSKSSLEVYYVNL